MLDVQPTLDRPTTTSPRRGEAPIVSTPSQRELAFKTFGPMDTGAQSRSSVVTSLVINGIALLLIVLISLTAKKIIAPSKPVSAVTFVPPAEPPLPPPPPKLPPTPVIKTVPPPVTVPTIVVPEPPKVQPEPVVTKAPPTPVPTPPAPKAVNPAPAPKPIPLHIAQAAAVPNNDLHPAAIRLGNMTNPINNTAGPAVSPVNLGRSGAPGMAAGNTGLGPPSRIALGGSGSPNGTLGGHDNAPQPIKGVSIGVTGGTGPMNARPVGAVAIATNNTPVAIPQTQASSTTPPKSAPKVLFKPRPDYTEEARQMHLEGTVTVKIHVASSGAVSVIGVQAGLGHGLDQSAVRAVQNMRFQPAMQNGQPTDWDGIVSIAFQLAG